MKDFGLPKEFKVMYACIKLAKTWTLISAILFGDIFKHSYNHDHINHTCHCFGVEVQCCELALWHAIQSQLVE